MDSIGYVWRRLRFKYKKLSEIYVDKAAKTVICWTFLWNLSDRMLYYVVNELSRSFLKVQTISFFNEDLGPASLQVSCCRPYSALQNLACPSSWPHYCLPPIWIPITFEVIIPSALLTSLPS
jgi:hypothetical protein